MNHRLISIGMPSDTAALDIVFVHGLTGGPYTTWNGLRDEPVAGSTAAKTAAGYEVSTSELMGEYYWPASLAKQVGKRFGSQKINVWSFGYPAPILKKEDHFAYTETLQTGVRPAVRTLVQGGIGAGTRRGVVFVGHSLGGLVIKAILDHCERSGDYNERRILESTSGVAFIATPHSGSGLATLYTNLTPVVGTVTNFVTGFAKWFLEPSNQIEWLEKASSTLRVLAENYREMATRRRISTRAYYETQPVKHIAQNLLWIVDASNADPGVPGCLPVGVPKANHIDICKPKGTEVFIRDDIEQWVLERVASQEQGKEFAVLATDIAEICASVRRADPERYNEALASPPRNLEDIPARGQVRAEFSHKFRTEANKRLDLVLGERLRSEPHLRTALEDSEWDLDRLILFLWLSKELKEHLQKFNNLLKYQTGWLEEHGDNAPSLILIYRVTDALRVALEDQLPGIRTQLKATHDWVEMTAAVNPAFDSDLRTRQILLDGFNKLENAAGWKQPPKAAPGTGAVVARTIPRRRR
jgi:hypothetical protein